MIYCLNPQCPHPENLDGTLFCAYCGSKLRLGDRYFARQPMSQGTNTFQGMDQGVSPPQPCIIKQISLQNLGSSNREKALEYFRQEAVKLKILGQHPQIPNLFAYFESENSILNFLPTLIQENIVGQSIDQEVFEEAEIVKLLNEVLPILQFIHDHQIIHRDLNPKNLIRRPNGQLVIVDLSAAKITRKTVLAQTGTLIGSAAYSAPEQLRGKTTYASDLYSLGVICIHLLTRFHPFELFSSAEGIWSWEKYLATSVNEKLRNILNKMLAESLNERYRSATEIYQDLNSGQTLVPTQLQSPISVPEVLSQVTPTWQCIRTLQGHTSSVHCLAFHPQGQMLASAGADRKILLWNLQDEKAQPQVLQGHRSVIDGVVWSGMDPQDVISGSWDYTIRFWQNGGERQRLDGHTGWIHGLAISPDGRILVSGSSDQTIKLWHLPQGTLYRTLQGHQGAVSCLAVSPDGQRLASGSADHTIKLWDLHTGVLLHTLTGHSDKVTTCGFSPSSQLLYSGSADQTLKVWHCASGKLIQTSEADQGGVHSLALNRTGNLLVSAGEDQTLTLWHPSKLSPLHRLRGHENAVRAVAFSPRESLIASAGQDQTVKLWGIR